MKKTVMLAVVGMFMATQGGLALAANPDSGPGCGLGHLAWQNYPHQKTIGVQTMEATTNGIMGNQTFGISSGTSGCTNDGKFWAEHKVNAFASLNFENLSQDMAQGRGEHLASLATLMGIPAVQQPAFLRDDSREVCVAHGGRRDLSCRAGEGAERSCGDASDAGQSFSRVVVVFVGFWLQRLGPHGVSEPFRFFSFSSFSRVLFLPGIQQFAR